jgi:ribosomal subunit interface protein
VTAKSPRRIRTHARDKITKLEKYFDGTEKIEAILTRSGGSASVELVMSVRKGKPLVCQCEDKDLYAAIDKVLDKAEALLTKRKERLKDHKGGKPAVRSRVSSNKGASKFRRGNPPATMKVWNPTTRSLRRGTLVK